MWLEMWLEPAWVLGITCNVCGIYFSIHQILIAENPSDKQIPFYFLVVSSSLFFLSF